MSKKKVAPIPDWYIENKSIKEVPNYVYGRDKIPASLKKIADSLFNENLLERSFFMPSVAKLRQDYHYRQCRKGAVRKDPTTGELVPLSDFARGRHKAIADNILFNRAKKWQECHPGETYKFNK